MAEAFTIFAVIWGWALLLLAFGAFIEWLGGGHGRRGGADIVRAPGNPKDEGADK